MAWLLLISLACFAFAWWRWHREFLRHWKHLESLVEDLAAGKRPNSFIFYHSPRFTRLASRFEAIHDQMLRLNKQLEEERFNSQAVLASMQEGVMITDASQGGQLVQKVNDSFLRMFAIPSLPAQATALSLLRDAAVEEAIRSVLASGEPQIREFSHGYPNTGFFSLSAVPLKDANNRLVGVVNVFHDITRLRQLEELRRDFVANVSHELRTPLSIFQGYLETLIDNPEIARGDLSSILQIMNRHSRRLNALLEDLLTLARLESRQATLEKVELNLPLFLQEIALDWQLKFSEKKVGLLLEDGHDGSEEIRLQADPLRLQQVLGNLLENSLKYTPEGGTIRIQASHSNGADGEVQISVADTGAGIPPQALPHIFERFYRVEKARSRETGGTGLGLSIVKHILGMHGGSVHAQSEPGKGTTITLVFPG